MAGSALRCKASLYSFYELSRANAICFKQEIGTLHYNKCARSKSKGHPGCLVVHFSVQLYISSGSKRKSGSVRINTDVLALVTKSECAVPEDIHLHATPIHDQSFRNYKVSGSAGSSKEKDLWGMTLFLKKTMSEKSLISKYALRNILPGIMPTFRKFCNLHYLAISYCTFDKLTPGTFVNL